MDPEADDGTLYSKIPMICQEVGKSFLSYVAILKNKDTLGTANFIFAQEHASKTKTFQSADYIYTSKVTISIGLQEETIAAKCMLK